MFLQAFQQNLFQNVLMKYVLTIFSLSQNNLIHRLIQVKVLKFSVSAQVSTNEIIYINNIPDSCILSPPKSCFHVFKLEFNCQWTVLILILYSMVSML